MSDFRLTNHAVERMFQRGISRGMIDQTLSKPDGKKAEDDGDTQFFRKLNGRQVHVVAKPIERNQWLIKTVWVNQEGDPSFIMKIISKLALPLLRKVYGR